MSDISSFSKLDNTYAQSAFTAAKKEQRGMESDLRKMTAAKKDLYAVLKKLGKPHQTAAQSSSYLKRADSDRKDINKYGSDITARSKKFDQDMNAYDEDKKLAGQDAPHSRHNKGAHGKHSSNSDGKHGSDSKYHGANSNPHMPSKLPSGLKSQKLSGGDSGTALYNSKHNDELYSDKNGRLGVNPGGKFSGNKAYVDKQGNVMTSKDAGYSWKDQGNVNKHANIYNKTKGIVGDKAARDLDTAVNKDHGDLGKYAKDPEATDGSKDGKKHEDHKKGYQGANPTPKLPSKLAPGLHNPDNTPGLIEPKWEHGLVNNKHNDQLQVNRHGTLSAWSLSSNNSKGAEVTKDGSIGVITDGKHWKNVGNINKGDDIYQKTRGVIGNQNARDLDTAVTKDHGDLGKYAQDPEAVSGGSVSKPKPKPKPNPRTPASKVNEAVNNVNKTFSFGDGKANKAGAKLEQDYAKGANHDQVLSDYNDYVHVISNETHTHGTRTKSLSTSTTDAALKSLRDALW